MHVGVCMKIKADSLEEASNIGINILKANSIEESVDPYLITVSPSSFMKIINPEFNGDDDEALLITEVEGGYCDIFQSRLEELGALDSSLEEIIEFPDEKDPEEFKEFIKRIFEMSNKNSDNYYYIDSISDLRTKDIGNQKIFEVVVNLFQSVGWWDYYYDTVENFGHHNDENGLYRFHEGKFVQSTKRIRTELIESGLMVNSEANKIYDMFDFWINEDGELLDSVEKVIDFLTKNLDEDYYLIMGTVHI